MANNNLFRNGQTPMWDRIDDIGKTISDESLGIKTLRYLSSSDSKIVVDDTKANSVTPLPTSVTNIDNASVTINSSSPTTSVSLDVVTSADSEANTMNASNFLRAMFSMIVYLVFIMMN
jgi:hypothetical protein